MAMDGRRLHQLFGAATLTRQRRHLRRISTMNAIRRFLKNDSAIAVTEYGLLVALIAVALIAVVLLFGQNISTWFTNKTSQITTV
jgi:Flp pilus assembly pilin Flp